jgi:hypothetical protein
VRIFPELGDDLMLRLFQKGAAASWTSRDLEWDRPVALDVRQRRALARLLTPVYLGEQTAMAGASAILPKLLAAGETSAQLYLSTFILDEARHFEALTRVYQAFGQEPMRLREMPDMLRYHHRLRQGDRIDWVWGILISDLYAKLFYRSFVAGRPGSLFGHVSARILEDESRHQAFALLYLRRHVPQLEPARLRALLEMRDELLRLIEGGLEQVREDCDALGFDGDALQARMKIELGHFGRRIGLDRDPEAADGPPGPDGAPPGAGSEFALLGRPPGPAAAPGAPAPGRRPSLFALPRCFGCLLVALCRRGVRRAAGASPGPTAAPATAGA